MTHLHPGLVLTATAIGLATCCTAADWRLPLPASPTPVPAATAPGWMLPGVYRSAVVSRDGLRNVATVDTLADHAIALDGVKLSPRLPVRLTFALAGAAATNAVWVAVGADNLPANGRLDPDECLLFAGLDRGRWGLRARGLGATTWSAAQLPAPAGTCEAEVTIDPVARTVALRVRDAGGWRTPPGFATFSPDWGGLTAATLVDWQRARVDVRGAGASLATMAVLQGSRTVVIVR